MVYVLRSRYFQKYIQHFNFISLEYNRIKNILRIGTPVAMQYVFEIGAFAGASLIAGKIGALEQASHQVAITLAAMTYMMASGIAAAATIKVGNRSEEHTSELQSRENLVCRLLLEKKKQENTH